MVCEVQYQTESSGKREGQIVFLQWSDGIVLFLLFSFPVRVPLPDYWPLLLFILQFRILIFNLLS